MIFEVGVFAGTKFPYPNDLEKISQRPAEEQISPPLRQYIWTMC